MNKHLIIVLKIPTASCTYTFCWWTVRYRPNLVQSWRWLCRCCVARVAECCSCTLPGRYIEPQPPFP